MSSTTNRRAGERGQTLAIFAFGLVGILAVAALVFDVGQNLFDRRKQQDAADAAALAAARWLTTNSCKAAPSVANCPEAVDAARELVEMHGYDAATQADINIPPDSSSSFGGAHGHVQVTITATRNSFFAGVLGLNNFRIAAMGVARNTDGYSLPYSLLALGQDCNKDGWVTGNGSVTIEGDIMTTGDCGPTGSLAFDGNSLTINFQGQCASTGGIDYGPGAVGPVCAGGDLPDVEPISDPLSGLMPPLVGGTTVPSPPLAPVVVAGTPTANRINKCPRQTQAGTSANPATCEITTNTNGNTIVRLFPGIYYGGLAINEGSTGRHVIVYLEPGIYYMAGGGFTVTGNADVYTVNPGGTAYGDAGTSGVMFFNSHNPADFAGCEAGTTGGIRCMRSVDVNNSGGVVQLRGYSGPVYTSLIVFQDRRPAQQTNLPVKLTGNAGMTLEGTLYLPQTAFEYAGNGTGEVLNAQVICETFKVSGGGSLAITYDPDDALKLSGAGLVE